MVCGSHARTTRRLRRRGACRGRLGGAAAPLRAISSRDTTPSRSGRCGGCGRAVRRGRRGRRGYSQAVAGHDDRRTPRSHRLCGRIPQRSPSREEGPTACIMRCKQTKGRGERSRGKGRGGTGEFGSSSKDVREHPGHVRAAAQPGHRTGVAASVVASKGRGGERGGERWEQAREKHRTEPP